MNEPKPGKFLCYLVFIRSKGWNKTVEQTPLKLPAMKAAIIGDFWEVGATTGNFLCVSAIFMEILYN